jgi:hypothetical protein
LRSAVWLSRSPVADLQILKNFPGIHKIYGFSGIDDLQFLEVHHPEERCQIADVSHKIELFSLSHPTCLLCSTGIPEAPRVKIVFRHKFRFRRYLILSEQHMIFPEAPDAAQSHKPISLPRRSVISSLGLAGLGLLASSATSHAFLSQKKSSSGPKVLVPTQAQGAPRERIDLTDLPADWTRAQGALLPDYTRYLWSLRLKTITPKQVITAHAKCKGSTWNSLPPKQWWTRMGFTLRVADRIAQEMNVDEIEIISAYRAPAYNARCAGARTGSWHQANVAVDVKFPMRASQVASTARNLRDRGLFKGGVGGYWNFTHIDTRGENQNW